jgi:hypothetical protein
MEMKTVLRFTLTAMLLAAAGMVVAVPGPSKPGDYYVYRNDAGDVVGRAWINCQGERFDEGTPTGNAVNLGWPCPPPTW